LPGRDGLDRLLLDVALLRIKPGIGADNAFAMCAVAFRQSVNGFDQLPLCIASHFGDHAGEVEKIRVEGPCCMFRDRDCHHHSFAALAAARLISKPNFAERLRPDVSRNGNLQPVPMITAGSWKARTEP